MKRIVLVLSMLLYSTATTYAGPPLISDDAGTVDVGSVEMELSSSYLHDKESVNGISMRREIFGGEAKLATGLYKNLGVSLTIPYTLSDRTTEDGNLSGKTDGFSDMTVDIKYAFAKLAGISFAIKPSFIVPAGTDLSEDSWRFGGTLIASKEFDEGVYTMHANLGYDHHDYRTEQAKASYHMNLLFGSIAGEARIAKGLTTVAELGLSTTQDKTTNELTSFALVGARYELNEHLDINVGFKFGLSKPEDDLTVRYGLVLKF